jgi:23S rRNA (pseudouridine1915-N3)-methyltransferase
MLLTILMIGKTTDIFVTEGTEIFIERLKHYLSVKMIVIPDLKERKNLSPQQIKEKEAELMIQQIPKPSTLILLDEQGREFRSIEFSAFIQKQLNSGCKELVFLIGGAFGVADSIKKTANFSLSLSKMTFTHQFIRLMLAEQLYRAMSILKNEPYHNE